jgi:hypothetical protein
MKRFARKKHSSLLQQVMSYHDTLHNDIHHDDTQINDIKHNYT